MNHVGYKVDTIYVVIVVMMVIMLMGTMVAWTISSCSNYIGITHNNASVNVLEAVIWLVFWIRWRWDIKDIYETSSHFVKWIRSCVCELHNKQNMNLLIVLQSLMNWNKPYSIVELELFIFKFSIHAKS